jgi:hypothetical protein
MTTPITLQAIEMIHQFATAVDFHQTKPDQVDLAPELPVTSSLWESSYAEMLALCSVLTEDDIRNNVRIGQEWLDARCMKREAASGGVVDAYLIILLGEKPPKTLHDVVREIELDPTACRKHFVWPSEVDDKELRWSRIFKITAIGLPPSPLSVGMTNTPKLEDRTQIEILDDIKNLKPVNAAKRHGEQVKPVPRR